jgi:hypothetical protein
MENTKFSPSGLYGGLDAAQLSLLSQRISELAIQIPGSCLEKLINQLYQELENRGISLKPKTYLSDEWGCPQGVPVIGIPFYLVDSHLCRLESQITGIDTETELETMMYLRHEAGHAFNYAHRLYLKFGWTEIFGRYSLPYQEVYRPVPFSAHFVHHVPGWYAQKHPDDDFAETFAVWLTPGYDWKKKYSGTPALTKLLYVEKLVSQYGRRPAVVTDEQLDKPIRELTMTLDSWYKASRSASHHRLNLPPIIELDLQRLFFDEIGLPAEELLISHRQRLVREVNMWTGIDRHIMESLIDDLIEKVGILKLKIAPDQSASRLIGISVFLATLVMNNQFRGQFVDV